MADEKTIIDMALKAGADAAAAMDTKDFVIKEEYRKFCEDNLCGNYDLLPQCPSKCGTVKEMTDRLKSYSRAIVFQKVVDPKTDPDSTGKKNLNIAIDRLTEELGLDESEFTIMSAGPWRKYSCLSAYCVDAQAMADSVGMVCWGNDGLIRAFSVMLLK